MLVQRFLSRKIRIQVKMQESTPYNLVKSECPLSHDHLLVIAETLARKGAFSEFVAFIECEAPAFSDLSLYQQLSIFDNFGLLSETGIRFAQFAKRSEVFKYSMVLEHMEAKRRIKPTWPMFKAMIKIKKRHKADSRVVRNLHRNGLAKDDGSALTPLGRNLLSSDHNGT